MEKETYRVVREVFQIPEDQPLVFQDNEKEHGQYKRMWDELLKEEDSNEHSSDLGKSQ